MDNTENKHRKYMSPYYTSGPIKVSDIVNNKLETVHLKIYNDALNKLMTTYNYSPKRYTFVEIRNSEYNLPSYVMIYDKAHPWKVKKEWLGEYWNTYQYDTNNKSLKDKNIGEYNMLNSELTNINYVSGEATFIDKLNDVEYKTDLSFITKDTKKSADYTLEMTFGYKLRNKIYGV